MRNQDRHFQRGRRLSRLVLRALRRGDINQARVFALLRSASFAHWLADALAQQHCARAQEHSLVARALTRDALTLRRQNKEQGTR